VTELLTEQAATPQEPVFSDLRDAWSWLFQGLAVVLGVFALWSAGPGIPQEHFLLAVYTLLTWILTLLMYPESRKHPWRDPASADWIIAALFAACVGGMILRADGVAELGATIADQMLWSIGALAAAAALFRRQARTLAFIALTVLAFGYYEAEFDELILRPGAWSEADFWLATLTVVLSLEVARRALGWWIPAVAIAALLYAYFGNYLPGALGHRGSSLQQIMNYMMYSQEGIFGVMTSVMASYVLIFIYLGAFMQGSGMGRFFIELPLAIAGRSAGGPAKVAVIASAVFGSISGSSLANIVSTGAFTIPLMKRVGFKPHVAGAVENTASLGGQLLPPVMGSGAFVMAEITGVSYVEIITLAAVPALLYMLSIGLIVHFVSKRSGIRGMEADEVESAKTVLRRGWFHIVPFAVLLSFLIAGYSPDWSAVMSIASIVAINWFRILIAWRWPQTFAVPEQRLDLQGLKEALVTGARNSLIVGSVAAAVGLIVGCVALTGLGLKMSYLLVSVADGSLLLLLLLIALASLVLGMALPITASYLVLVVLAGPALQELGVALIAAHMIVYWLSQDSNITPPVCLGAYVAASIALADPWKTGWTSFRFAKMLYVMPLLFAYTPILLTGSTQAALWVMVTATAGTIAFAALTVGWLHRAMRTGEWIVLGGITALCFVPADVTTAGDIAGWHMNIAGMLSLLGLYLWQRRYPLSPADHSPAPPRSSQRRSSVSSRPEIRAS
jgi:TRAP transporter 4TM/12TM fusion protein